MDTLNDKDDLAAPRTLTSLAPEEQAFFLAICRDNCPLPGIQGDHEWIDRTEAGLVKLSAAGERRLHQLQQIHPEAVEEGMVAARAHWRAWGIALLRRKLHGELRPPTLH